MQTKPTLQEFSLSEEVAGRIERQIKPDMSFRLFWIYLTVLLLGAGAYGRADDSRWRSFFIILAGIGGLGVGVFFVEKVCRLLHGFQISDEQWANHARYRTASNAYLDQEAKIEEVRRETERRTRESLRRQVGWWQSLDGWKFENEVAALLTKGGYTVQQTGGPGDEGVDLILRQNDATILVQCKALNRDVGPGAVRDLYGALMHHGANEAWLVTSRGFSSRARHFAAGKPISLLTIRDVLSRAGSS